MFKQIYLLIVLLISTTLFSQVTNEGEPVSWKMELNTKAIKNHFLPKFNITKLQQEDLINDKLVMPYRFGYKHEVSYGFKDGKWTTLENGDRIWRIQFTSKNALSMNVIFDEFFMPKGGKVYLYNGDKSDLLGAYTAIQNQKSGSLGTWLVQGETLWIEYYEPKKVANQGKLHISNITHGYRGVPNKDLKVLGGSGNCNHDVDCPIGADWEDHKDTNKKAVALILANGADWCSGALINNTANDQTPYFLTADHCIDGENTLNWAFRFGWISPNPVCGSSSNSTNGPTNMTISGATVKANSAGTDFALLELNTAIPTAWNRVWSGWDKSDTDPNFVVGIHHPNGDIMKICRNDTGTVKSVYSGIPVWEITSASQGWELGVTEPGSSGSPLYDENGKIIGQLLGGNANCFGINDNGGFDVYGRFGVSWAGGGTNSTRLSNWLDPTNSGATTLESYPPAQTYTLDASIAINTPSCGINQINPSITLTNNGSLTITSATIVWNLNGGTNQTINWTGFLLQNTSTNISLGNITLSNGSHTLNALVNSPNNGVDENNTNDATSKDISIDVFSTTQVHLNLIPDNHGSETTWEFRDSSNTILYSGGPYTNNDSTPINQSFNVSDNECYTFIINDSDGDGICCGFGAGSYTLTDDGGTVIFTGGEFITTESTEIAVSSTAGVTNILSKLVTIYPNPTNTNLTINLNSNLGFFSYKLVNTLGQTILQGDLLQDKNTLNVSSLTEGIYFLRIANRNSKDFMVEKIIISK